MLARFLVVAMLVVGCGGEVSTPTPGPVVPHVRKRVNLRVYWPNGPVFNRA